MESTGLAIEYVVRVFIGMGFVLGLTKGFVKLFFSWFSILLGIIVAVSFSRRFTLFFFPNESSNILIVLLMGLILFVIVYAILAQFSWGITQTLQKMNLGSLDYLMGGVLGAIQTMIILGFIIYWIVSMGWIDMSSYPVSMFSMFFADKMLVILGSHVPLAQKILK